MRTLPFDYAVRNLGRSPLRLALSVGGSALVVLLVLAAAGFTHGMQEAMRVSAAPNGIMLIGSGSEESIERSEIPIRAAGIVSASVSGLLSRAGVDAVSPEIHLAMPLSTDPDVSGKLAVIRGVTPEAWLVHDNTRLVHGHAPRPGHSEFVAGQLAALSLGFDPPESIIGTTFHLDHEPYEVVGVIDAGGSVIDGELWTALTDLQVTAQRDSISTIILRVNEAEFADLEAFAATRLDLELAAIEETTYYAQLNAFFRPIRLLVIVTAILIAIGGITGGLNTMYAAFASRVREIGSLQTLGFSRGAILWSLIQESVLASSIGSLLGCGIGLLILDHFVIRFSMGIFGISMNPEVLALGLASGLMLGVIGAAVPAWRCLRRPIPDALRASE